MQEHMRLADMSPEDFWEDEEETEAKKEDISKIPEWLIGSVDSVEVDENFKKVFVIESITGDETVNLSEKDYKVKNKSINEGDIVAVYNKTIYKLEERTKERRKEMASLQNSIFK